MTPYALWRQSGGDREKYRALLIEHGLLVPRCQFRGEATKRRCVLEANHEGNHNFEPRHVFSDPKEMVPIRFGHE